MKLTAKTHYACLALLELAIQYPTGKAIHVEEISARQNIPLKYLVQILNQLKKAGLVESSRGQKGGYKLAKSPHNITLGKTLRILSGPIIETPEKFRKNKTVFSSVWKEIEEAISSIIDNITMADLVEKKKAQDGYYSFQI